MDEEYSPKHYLLLKLAHVRQNLFGTIFMVLVVVVFLQFVFLLYFWNHYESVEY